MSNNIDNIEDNVVSSGSLFKSYMPNTLKVGYVVFHSGNQEGMVPFYLTKSHVAFSSNFEAAEIFDTPTKAIRVMKEIYSKIKSDIECRNYLGVGRITFEVVDRSCHIKREEVVTKSKNKELLDSIGCKDSSVEIVFLADFVEECTDIYAIPTTKVVRIKCGSGSPHFYEIDCRIGNATKWIEHMEDKVWYVGLRKEIANEYIRHFCEKWGK